MRGKSEKDSIQRAVNQRSGKSEKDRL